MEDQVSAAIDSVPRDLYMRIPTIGWRLNYPVWRAGFAEGLS